MSAIYHRVSSVWKRKARPDLTSAGGTGYGNSPYGAAPYGD